MLNCKKRLLGAAALVVWLAQAGAVTSKAEESFRMDGTLFSGCKAAEPYSLQRDGRDFKPEYKQRCTGKRKKEVVAVRRPPTCEEGTWSPEKRDCINIKPDF